MSGAPGEFVADSSIATSHHASSHWHSSSHAHPHASCHSATAGNAGLRKAVSTPIAVFRGSRTLKAAKANIYVQAKASATIDGLRCSVLTIMPTEPPMESPITMLRLFRHKSLQAFIICTFAHFSIIGCPGVSTASFHLHSLTSRTVVPFFSL